MGVVKRLQRGTRAVASGATKGKREVVRVMGAVNAGWEAVKVVVWGAATKGQREVIRVMGLQAVNAQWRVARVAELGVVKRLQRGTREVELQAVNAQWRVARVAELGAV